MNKYYIFVNELFRVFADLFFINKMISIIKN